MRDPTTSLASQLANFHSAKLTHINAQNNDLAAKCMICSFINFTASPSALAKYRCHRIRQLTYASTSTFWVVIWGSQNTQQFLVDALLLRWLTLGGWVVPSVLGDLLLHVLTALSAQHNDFPKSLWPPPPPRPWREGSSPWGRCTLEGFARSDSHCGSLYDL